MSGFEELMAEVAERQRFELRRLGMRAEIERRLAAGPAPAARLGLVRPMALAGALAAAAVVLFAVGAHRERTASLSFDVGDPGHPGRAGDVIEPAAAGTSLVFSDGSRVEVAAGARARVDALTDDGATVTLVDGAVDVSVVHRALTRWQIRAGDYRVQVTGTRFAVAWQARAGALDVRLFEGAVVVTGPGVAGGSSRVVAGQRLHVTSGGGSELRDEPAAPIGSHAQAPPPPAAPASPRGAAPRAQGARESALRDVASRGPRGKRAQSGRVSLALNAPAVSGGEAGAASREMAANRAAEPLASATPIAPTAPSFASPAPPRASGSANAGTSSARAPADWRVLAARGRYHDALRAAVAANFDDQCKRLPSDELLLLGDVARLDGDAARASHAYDVALTRFPDADRTTFALGVVAFESRHDYADAARWFDRYLRDHPRGPLATAAAGRLMESYSRGGDAARARTAARAYLREHPQGPHAALARRIASGS